MGAADFGGYSFDPLFTEYEKDINGIHSLYTQQN